MAREAHRAQTVARLEAARAACAADPADGEARAALQNAADVVRAEAELESRRRDFTTGG